MALQRWRPLPFPDQFAKTADVLCQPILGESPAVYQVKEKGLMLYGAHYCQLHVNDLTWNVIVIAGAGNYSVQLVMLGQARLHHLRDFPHQPQVHLQGLKVGQLGILVLLCLHRQLSRQLGIRARISSLTRRKGPFLISSTRCGVYDTPR